MRRISELTKRDIFDLTIHGFQETVLVQDFHPDFKEFYKDEEAKYEMSLYGRLDEIAFLKRLYPLDEMESYDSRFSNAEDDIWQHTVNNEDYEINWIFQDERFELLNGDDSIFLNFISEIFHPSVRNEREPWEVFLKKFNVLLGYDGYELYETKKISGRSVYSWRSINDNLIMEKQISDIKTEFNSDYVSSQVTLMYELINTAPNSAIGKAKELLEICCKTILDQREVSYATESTVIQLMKYTCDTLELNAKKIPEEVKGNEIATKILGNLSNISQGMSELRNLYGDGHGKNKDFKTLPPRYAHLAVGASVTTVHFLWETYKVRNEKIIKNIE